MSSNNANTKKTISQIYTALDSHSYSKVVKLCQNLAPSNKLGQALLAHAYAKLGPTSRYKALETIYTLLSTSTSGGEAMEWPELVRELRYAFPMEQRHNETTLLGTPAASSSSTKPSKSSGKKSKGKKTSSSQATSSAPTRIDLSSIVPQDWDWIDVLDEDSSIELPKVPVPPSTVGFGSIDDLTIRHTLTATLKVLRLPITAYQLNCNDPEVTIWEHGLAVWMRQSHLGNTEQDDSWLEGLLPSTGRGQWDKRKLNENDEITKKVQILRNIGRDSDATTLLKDTLTQYPDDWEYWDLLFSVDSETSAEAFMVEMLAKHSELRGPRLMEIKRKPSPQLIMAYGETFCERAHCSHSDILTFLRDMINDDSLIQWSRQLTSIALDSEQTNQIDDALRRRILRRYIFGVKVQFTLHSREADTSRLVDWDTLVRQWQIYKDFESTLNLDQAQKEDRPPDELMLLAAQRLLVDVKRNQHAKFEQDDTTLRQSLIALSLLEAAIEYSPHNFKLKLAAIEVYSGLHATYRAWELYQQLFLKHIQHETCSYVITQHLLASGLYDEAFIVCRCVQDFHIKSSRELKDGVKHAMESGNAGKADEFMQFHKTKLQPSLVLQQAKALTLDLSPLLSCPEELESSSSKNDIRRLGGRHGIIGGLEDMSRATEMISEAHNQGSAIDALQIFRLASSIEQFVDNRDKSIKSYDILESIYKGENEADLWVWNSSMHRSLQHSLLVRATLCADGSKGLRKGKVVQCSPALSKRCRSLWSTLQHAIRSMDNNSALTSVYRLSLTASVALCRAMLSLCGGVDKTGDFTLEDLESREKSSVLLLGEAAASIKSIGHATTNSHSDSSQVSTFLLDCFVHLFALTRIFSNTAETFGFGKRKRQTKAVAGAVAEVASSLHGVVEGLQSTAEQSLSLDLAKYETDVLNQTKELIDGSFVKQTINHITKSRHVTQARLLSYLEYMRQELNCFDETE